MLALMSLQVLADDSQAKLNALLSNFEAMSADFNQTAIVKKAPQKKSVGTMALKRPGKFRWEITSPNRQIIIADGKYLWIYDVDLEQATKKGLTKDANSPASLLSGSGDAIAERFTLVDAKQEDNANTFKLKPKKNGDMIQSVELKFVDDKLNQMTVLDNLGQQTIFKFSNVKVNPSLSSSLFKFSAPKGVDIIQD